MAAPRISILIPTFNRAGMLATAVESALAQTWANLEVLVSDNASTDETAQVMAPFTADPRLTYHRNPVNVGMVANWRQLLHWATGDYFLLLSDDDELLVPTYLSTAAALIEENPDLAVVYAHGYILDTRTGERRELRLPFHGIQPGGQIFACRDRVRPQDFTLCNVLFNRNLALHVGAFSNPHNLSCDSELFLSLCLLGRVAVVEEMVSVYRMHSGNLIDTVGRDYDLLTQNMEMYLKPHALALQLGCLRPEERHAFEEVLLQALRRTLLEVANQYPGRYGECVAWLQRDHPALLRQARANLKFQRRLLRLRWRQWRGIG